MTTPVDFQKVFEFSPNALMLLDRELRFVAANAAYLRATGTTLEGLLGRHLLDVFPGDPADPGNTSARRLRTSFEKVLATGGADVIALLPYRVPDAVGGAPRTRYWTATHTPIPGEDGEVTFVLQHTSDVTDLRPQGATDEVLAATLLGHAHVVDEANTLLNAERDHLRRLFEQAPGLVAILQGPDQVIQLVNGAFRRFVGEREFVGRSVRDALPELSGQGFFRLLGEVYSTGRPALGHASRLLLRRQPEAEPEEAFVDFVFQPILDVDGRVTGIFVQGHDVTEQLQLATERERAWRELHFLAEALPQQVWTAEPDGYLDFVNHRFAEYVGLREEQLHGTRWRARAHPEDLPRVSTRWEHSLKTGEPIEFDCRLRASNGVYRWFLMRALPFRDEAGHILKWYGTNTDVDAARAVSEELKARTEYEQQLIGIVSHDLKNPLTAILMSAQVGFRHKHLDARQQRAVTRIISSAERATRLIGDLLDHSRSRFAGGLPISPSPLSLDAIVREVQEELLEASPDRTISLRHEGPVDGRWDRDRLWQAVGNLIGNALQHGPPDAAIVVTSGICGDEAFVSVQNDGPPIPAEVLGRLFEPFRRGAEKEGLGRSVGLGLYITRQIAEAHGGTIEVSSTKDAGTTFTLRLPRFVEVTEAAGTSPSEVEASP